MSTEAEMRRKAQERLAAARTALDETVHRPAGDKIRDEAVREFHEARALAGEWSEGETPPR